MLKSMQEVLEYGFQVLNERYFDGELPPIVITIMSSKSLGHFTINKEWRVDQEHFNEINIGAEHLSRPIENIMATLAHEMTHYYCQLNGISDTSQNYRYHNKRFKEEAEKRGLIISYAKYIGYSVTEPSQQFIEVLRDAGIEKPMDINRDGYIDLSAILGILGGLQGGDNGQGGANGVIQKPKSSTRKYICPCCGSSFRGTRTNLRVLCMDCNEQFVVVEK